MKYLTFIVVLLLAGSLLADDPVKKQAAKERRYARKTLARSIIFNNETYKAQNRRYRIENSKYVFIYVPYTVRHSHDYFWDINDYYYYHGY